MANKSKNAIKQKKFRDKQKLTREALEELYKEELAKRINQLIKENKHVRKKRKPTI